MRCETSVVLAVMVCVVAGGDDTHVNLPNIIIGDPNDAISDVLGAPLSAEEFKTSLRRPSTKKLRTKNDPITSSGYFQGDIMVTSEDHLYQIILGDPKDQLSAVRNPQKMWPEAQIPYVISSAFSSWERSVIAGAVAEFHKKTCIRFVERVTQADYVHILRGQGCSSAVGRSGGPQVVSLGAGCVQHGVVVHELMHAAGFWHEQSRYDRDQYVTINWSNIIQGQEYNFEKKSNTITTDLGLAYDYASVMHYDAFAFASSYSAPTILPKQSGVNIGQRTGLSELDARGLNLLYKCGSDGWESTPAPESCVDQYEQCGAWAASGWCRTNNAYMDVNCKMSCNTCEPQVCRDENAYCGVWASVGECQSNPGYMLVFCGRACGTC
ncbi:zinc metalloproteinase nas-4 [Procambarus clarkii]|uniref:zinc metalloproteinase nas-4 n=1 Tax=Procambarus clarkii TaxID=6728 RepID=UPI001E6750F6|nr:zinc metalloproteinase nas-4-like [Procambarus clarkii]XP_045583757.1 zinc metalloproteinase nas-4-like [Procambarus clarkii]